MSEAELAAIAAQTCMPCCSHTPSGAAVVQKTETGLYDVEFTCRKCGTRLVERLCKDAPARRLMMDWQQLMADPEHPGRKILTTSELPRPIASRVFGIPNARRPKRI
jgi:hypothetical protein